MSYEQVENYLMQSEEKNKLFQPPSSMRKIADNNYSLYIALEEMQLKTYPNPFNNQTTIKYHLPKASKVNLQIFDFLGRPIATLAKDENQAAGWHEQQFQATNNTAGTYFLVLTNGDQQKIEKIILIK